MERYPPCRHDTAGGGNGTQKAIMGRKTAAAYGEKQPRGPRDPARWSRGEAKAATYQYRHHFWNFGPLWKQIVDSAITLPKFRRATSFLHSCLGGARILRRRRSCGRQWSRSVECRTG